MNVSVSIQDIVSAVKDDFTEDITYTTEELEDFAHQAVDLISKVHGKNYLAEEDQIPHSVGATAVSILETIIKM